MSGEHPTGRQAMDRLTGQLVKQGVKPAEAEKIARNTARKADHDNYGRKP